MKKMNNKGFTLIEILAVVTILGITMAFALPQVGKLIQRGKNENIESQKKTLSMASQSYAQEKKEILPKAIGETTIVTAQELRDAKFLKEDIVNGDKKSCMSDSGVRIYKYGTNDYSYIAFVYCEGDDVPTTIEGIKPDISITFTDENDSPITEAKDNVSIAAVQITYDGGKYDDGTKIPLDGYSYSIYVGYAESDALVEIFNSGSLNASNKENLRVKKNISDYVDITKDTYFQVVADAYNRDGGYLRKTTNSNFKDTEPPICGEITGQAGANEWDNTWRKKKITVKCSDGDGSGCTKASYTKTFKTESEFGYITIKDNAGNTTDCKVRVHLDWTVPTMTINAYTLNSNGTPGTKQATIKVDKDNPTKDLNSYTNGYGDDHWLNKDKFPYGIYFEVITSDNVSVGKGTWSENGKNIKKNGPNVDKLSKKSSKDFTTNENKTSFKITDEGWRIGEYVLQDKAKNEVKISITAPIDQTKPKCKSSGGSSWTKANVTITGTCVSDNLSGCAAEVNKTYKADINSSTETPGDIYDVAGNKTTCPKDRLVQIDNTPPTVPSTLFYMWKDSDKEPTSNTGLANYTPGVCTKNKIFTTHSESTDTGSGGIYYGYKETYRYAESDTAIEETKDKVDYKNATESGTTIIQWRACDKLGNCSAYSQVKDIKIDYVKPKIYIKGKAKFLALNNSEQRIADSMRGDWGPCGAGTITCDPEWSKKTGKYHAICYGVSPTGIRSDDEDVDVRHQFTVNSGKGCNASLCGTRREVFGYPCSCCSNFDSNQTGMDAYTACGWPGKMCECYRYGGLVAKCCQIYTCPNGTHHKNGSRESKTDNVCYY